MIEQIFIENYKSIRNAKIRLNSLNVFIPSNGVGTGIEGKQLK